MNNILLRHILLGESGREIGGSTSGGIFGGRGYWVGSTTGAPDQQNNASQDDRDYSKTHRAILPSCERQPNRQGAESSAPLSGLRHQAA